MAKRLDVEGIIRKADEVRASFFGELEGQRVIKYVKTVEAKSGIRIGSILFENGAVITLGVPVSVEGGRHIDFSSGDTIPSYDYWTIDDLNYKMGMEENPARQRHYWEIKRAYETFEP